MTWLNRLLAILVLLLGISLIWIGAQLLLAGGSPYYVAGSLAFIAVAGLLWRQSARALYVYAAIWTLSLAYHTLKTS